ncbi:hypothetical protein GALL_336580 [mine drainage metagenome]|uniref:Uncharacterized protein n=1 Tax=mine drainage metagenome TaxID=410659 RepID=A0A1J5R8Q0_9ZZZZ
MFSPHSRGLTRHLTNLMGALTIGLVFAYIGLNAASGCGQGGQCIRLSDFMQPGMSVQVAAEMPHRI